MTNAELITYGVIHKQIPKYLFKYRYIDAHLDDIILKSELWFSSAEKFNDPFDCQIKVNTVNTHREIKDYLAKFAQTLSRKQIRELASKLYENNEDRHNLFNSVFSNDLNKRGLCCFCENETNILLWSHYTKSHKGVCLKFDVLEDPELFVFPIKIKYEEKYPVYNHLRDSEKIIESLIGTKAKCWEYEKEMRIMKPSTGAFKFNKSALVEIIFGCNCEEKEIKRIKKLALDSGYINTIFKKAIKKENEFGLDFING